MLSPKPWRTEAVIGLMLGMFLCLSTGMLLATWLSPKGGSGDSSAVNFAGFALGMLSFQGASLVLIAQFLRHHQLGWIELLGLRSPRLPAALRMALVVGLVSVPCTLVLGLLSTWALQAAGAQAEAQDTIKVLGNTVDLGERVLFAVMAVGLAPFVEETLFRGIFYTAAKQAGYPRIAFWGVSVVFAAIHGNLPTFLPLLVLSAALTWLYEWADALIAPIAAHACFNAANFTMFILGFDPLRFLGPLTQG